MDDPVIIFYMVNAAEVEVFIRVAFSFIDAIHKQF